MGNNLYCDTILIVQTSADLNATLDVFEFPNLATLPMKVVEMLVICYLKRLSGL